MRCRVLCWVCLLAVSTARGQWPEHDPRPAETSMPPFRAAWTTGERTIERLAGWDKASPALELEGKPLAGPEKSVRWLRSTRLRSKPVAGSGAHFFGDDFLPGVVVGQTTESG